MPTFSSGAPELFALNGLITNVPASAFTSVTPGSTRTGYLRAGSPSHDRSSWTCSAGPPPTVTSWYVIPLDSWPSPEFGSTLESAIMPRGKRTRSAPVESVSTRSPSGPIAAVRPASWSGNVHVVGAAGESSTRSSCTPEACTENFRSACGNTDG